VTYNQPTLGYKPVKPYMSDGLRAALSFRGIDPQTVTEWKLMDDGYYVRLDPKIECVNIRVKPVQL
jgi:hypothetical protein